MRYPWILAIGTILAIVAVFALPLLLNKAKNVRHGGKRVSNTSGLRQSQLFEHEMKLRKLTTRAVSVICAVCLIGSFAILARPAKSAEYDSVPARKDIMLCLDISGSLCGQNLQIVKTMKETVKGLEGERVGITVFNISSLVDVPLTDDYAYVTQKLDELEVYLKYQEEAVFGNNLMSPFDMSDEELICIDYYSTAISYGPDAKGSSLVGEGLATALYAFPHLEEEERSRAIVLSTDNEVQEGSMDQIMTLEEAASECERTGVEVIALYPSGQTAEMRKALDLGEKDPADEENLKKAAEKTGGAMYGIDSGNPARDVVAAIDKIERQYTGMGEKVTAVYDDPEAVISLLLIAVAVLAALRVWWRT